MNSKIEKAALSTTQMELATQFFEDRIQPCLLRLLERAKNNLNT